MRVLTVKESNEWLKNKCLELDIESIEDLEEFAHNTDDFSLGSEIGLHIQSYIQGLYSFLVLDHQKSFFKVEIDQFGDIQTLNIDKRNISNLDKFKKLDSGDNGELLILDGKTVEIVGVK